MFVLAPTCALHVQTARIPLNRPLCLFYLHTAVFLDDIENEAKFIVDFVPSQPSRLSTMMKVGTGGTVQGRLRVKRVAQWPRSAILLQPRGTTNRYIIKLDIDTELFNTFISNGSISILNESLFLFSLPFINM